MSPKSTTLTRNVVVAAASVAAVCLQPAVQAWSPSSGRIRTRDRVSSSPTLLTAYLSAEEASLISYNRNDVLPITEEAYTSLFDDDDDDDDDIFLSDVQGFQQLQQSLGSEVLSAELQQQITKAVDADHPNQVLDSLADGASMMEKVAMSSIPEQLPQPAVQALQQEKTTYSNKSNNKKSKAKKNALNFAGERLSHEQEIALARLVQEGVLLHKIRHDQGVTNRQEWAQAAGLSTTELRRRVVNYRQAKQALVTANMGLVHAVVNQRWSAYGSLSSSSNGISRDELVQEGSLGLIRAAELFDPERGLRFSTYATIWVKASLSNSHVTELVKLPLREKTKMNKIQAACSDLEKERGGDVVPTVEELAAVTGLSVKEVVDTQQKMNNAKHVLSLDYEYASQSRSGVEAGTSGTVLESLQNKDKAFQADADLAERTQLQADLVAAMARNLDSREARLMRLRYGLSDGRQRTIAECADSMGLSQTRVQQLAQKCLKKLREAAEAESLEEYLLTIA